MPPDDGGARARIQRYADTAPRPHSRVEDFGPLTLFVRTGGGDHQYYARPTPDAGEATEADVQDVLARQRELGVPRTIEWIAELAPGLGGACESAGLWVHAHPLMVHDPAATTVAVPEHRIRILGPGHALLASALAVARLGFAEPGTGVGAAGYEELGRTTAATMLDGQVPALSQRIADGETVVAIAERHGFAICAGHHNPVGEVTEIVGVATLPVERRRGLARAVTTALVGDAHEHAMATVFLAAGDDDVARVYEAIGFRRVGTAMIAEALGQR